LVLVNSEKASSLFERLSPGFDCVPRSMEEAAAGNPRLTSPIAMSPQRGAFFSAWRLLPFEEVSKRFLVPPFRGRPRHGSWFPEPRQSSEKSSAVNSAFLALVRFSNRIYRVYTEDLDGSSALPAGDSFFVLFFTKVRTGAARSRWGVTFCFCKKSPKIDQGAAAPLDSRRGLLRRRS
jgi:hypothetical protein